MAQGLFFEGDKRLAWRGPCVLMASGPHTLCRDKGGLCSAEEGTQHGDVWLSTGQRQESQKMASVPRANILVIFGAIMSPRTGLSQSLQERQGIHSCCSLTHLYSRTPGCHTVEEEGRNPQRLTDQSSRAPGHCYCGVIPSSNRTSELPT